jgi:hypothetical protein
MATHLTGTAQSFGQDIYTDSPVQTMPLGSYAETDDGRGFRYVKAGASALVPGKAYQAAAEDTTNMTLSGGHSVGITAVGATQITLTNSITLAANVLAGGYLSVNVTPGQGQLYKIKSNTAVTASAGMVITLEDPLRVALTASSKVIFLPCPFCGVVVDPGTATGVCVGVAHTVISAGQYGWIQTKGPVSALFTGSGVTGKAVGLLTGGTSGSLAPAIAATPIVGYNMGTSITGEYALIYLTLG